MQVPIKEIRVKEGRRRLDMGHVKELADSIRELGLLNPVTIDKEKNLIAGLHRLEAVKQLGRSEVECTLSSLDGLQAELAEIDENFVRSGLSAVEYGEMLLRRKEIYETLHPETKAGAAQAAAMNRAVGNNVADKMSATSKSFVEDTAEKLNIAPRTVRREIQTAKNLTTEAKEIIRNADTKISKKAAMKLSRLEPGQQKEAAALLAAKEIGSVEEYMEKAGKASPFPEPGPAHTELAGQKQRPQQQAGQEKAAVPPAPVSPAPDTAQESGGVGLKEIIAELKDPDKDCSGTPDSFLQEYAAFVRKFHREIGWYSDPYYDAVYPLLTEGQLAELEGLTGSLCSAAEGLFRKVETAVRQKGME